MSEWKQCTLADLGEIVGGATPSTKNDDYYGGDIAWITPKDLSTFHGRFISHGERNITAEGLKNSSARLMPPHSVLFTSRAPIGYVAIAENEVCTNQGFKSIVPNSDTDYLFLYYLLVHNRERIENMGSGTTFKEVSGAVMKQISVSVPTDIEEQKSISAILGALDDKIENNTKINHHLEQMAQVIFKSWFVDFEPFGGVMPDDWCEGILGDYCSVKSGFAFKSAWWQESGIRVIKIKNITENGFDFSGCSFVSDDKVSYAKDFVATAGDVLIAMTGATIGKFAIIPQHDETLLVNQRVGKFFLGTDPLNRLPFLWCLLKQDEVFNEIVNRGQGSAQPNISPTDIMTIPIIIPSGEVLDNFNNSLRSCFETMILNAAENQKLSDLRDTLLPRLMSGELSVADIQAAK